MGRIRTEDPEACEQPGQQLRQIYSSELNYYRDELRMNYSKTSLNRPFSGVSSCGPFTEVVYLENSQNTGKIRYH